MEKEERAAAQLPAGRRSRRQPSSSPLIPPDPFLTQNPANPLFHSSHVATLDPSVNGGDCSFHHLSPTSPPLLYTLAMATVAEPARLALL